MKPPARPGFARTAAVAAPARTLQPAGADRVFAATSRVLQAPLPPTAVGEELLPGPGGGFHVRSAQRQTLMPPTGTFNFVRVHGDMPSSRPVLVSSRLPHAQIAAGRPVVYAGTARFEAGEMAWWSNYSGTYQPIAAFRAQAGLPEEKFVPWQRLQMGGIAMQRVPFGERRTSEPAPTFVRPEPRAAGSASVSEKAEPSGVTKGGKIVSDASDAGAAHSRSKGR